MIRRAQRTTRTDTLVPYTTLVRSELHPVLGDDRRGRGRRAGAVPGLEVERLLLLHVLVGKRVEAAAGELRAQRVVDPLTVAEHAGAEELDHQQVGVSVDHQAGQAVAFAVDHAPGVGHRVEVRSEEHTSELQSLMRNSYAVFCLKKKKT